MDFDPKQVTIPAFRHDVSEGDGAQEVFLIALSGASVGQVYPMDRDVTMEQGRNQVVRHSEQG